MWDALTVCFAHTLLAKGAIMSRFNHNQSFQRIQSGLAESAATALHAKWVQVRALRALCPDLPNLLALEQHILSGLLAIPRTSIVLEDSWATTQGLLLHLRSPESCSLVELCGADVVSCSCIEARFRLDGAR